MTATNTSESGSMRRRDFLRASGAVLLGQVLYGCGSSLDPGVGMEVDPRLASRPGTPRLSAARGITRLGLASGRDGLLYVPGRYNPAVSAPLLVALHGSGGSCDEWGSLYEYADAEGMIILAPDSRRATWNVFLEEGVRDIGPDIEFLDRALAYTFDRCNVEPTRIALGGFSDGASYALTLGLSNGDLFRRLLGFSPGFIVSDVQRVGRPPIFVSHGTQDTVIPVASSRDKIVPSLRAGGYDVTYEEFIGRHEVPAAVKAAAMDWLRA